MKLLTKEIERKLLKNNSAIKKGEAESSGMLPVVKFFNPCGDGTWLITDMDSDGIMFGLCDLGWGTPEIGYVSLDELKSVNVGFGLGIERDLWFEADKTLQGYIKDSREKSYIDA